MSRAPPSRIAPTEPPIETISENAVRLLAPQVAIVFLAFLTVGIPLPVLSVQVHDVLGYGAVTVGWVVGVQSLATVLTRQFAGVTCDRHGPKRSVLIGLPIASLAGVTYIVSTLAPLTPAVSLLILLAGRLLLGVAESLFLTGTLAWGIARARPERTGLVMAWQGIAMYAALAAGAPIGLAVLAVSNFATVAAATVLLPILAMAIAIGMRGVRGGGGVRIPFYRVIGTVLRPGLALAMATIPFAAMASFVALDYARHGWHGAGLALAAFGLAYILVRLFFAHLPDRYGGGPVAAISLAIEAAGQALLWAATSPMLALLGATLTGLGLSLVFPAMGVVAVRSVPASNRGLAIGGYVAFFDIAIGLGGPLTGIVAAHAGYAAVFLAGAVTSLIGIVLALAGGATPAADP